MAPLSAVSAAAIARLSSYVPPRTVYANLPLSRRAAVLILLFADRKGDLRVVLTLRANTLRSYAGQVALPGGKADTLEESTFSTARREAFEEIGLPLNPRALPPTFTIHHLCELPLNLAKTSLGVRPCVAYLSTTHPTETADEVLLPRLSAPEVSAVFTAPLRGFLKKRGVESETGEAADGGEGDEEWYQGQWMSWHESSWRMHNFYVPIAGQKVVRPKPKMHTYSHDRSEEELLRAEEAGLITRYRVWGMTARILVDAARIAYGEEPEFEHNAKLGDEDLIERLIKEGELAGERERGEEVSRHTLRREKEAKI